MYQLGEAGAKTLQSLLAAPEWSLSADEFLRQVEQPMLVIFGKRDTVVDWRESIGVYRAAFMKSGNRDLTIKTFADADHEMRPGATRQSKDSTFVSGYTETMIRWLKARDLADVPR